MIVRILGEGQYELPDGLLPTLEKLDWNLNGAIESDDEDAFSAALGTLIETVRASGKELDPAVLVPSDLTVPHEGSTLADLRQLFESEPDTDTVPEGA
ncbi:MAG TPA: hypothetical protein VFN50_06795 [Acidimicrobiales bacterium]|nr:hypothetical protein [Acidimicrobiales bacterium]